MFADVVEWQEFREDVIFWKWNDDELEKGSRVILKAGQDAVFMYNGRVEGIFEKEGTYELQSDIIPFLSTLKGFRFGFNSGLRAEVLFVNNKEIELKWGTQNAINIPSEELPGGLPVRAFGTLIFKVSDYITLIDKIAGVKKMYTVEELRGRIVAVLDKYLMKWILQEGKDMFRLQASAFDIAEGIKTDLDFEMRKIGISILDFNIQSFNYPEEIQEKINKAAAFSMVKDVDKYQNLSAADAMGKGNSSMSDALGMAAGMKMANKLFDGDTDKSIECPSCDAKIPADSKFCPECGQVVKPKGHFCASCGAANTIEAKFCVSCGQKM